MNGLTPTSDKREPPEIVIVVHGIGSNRLFMWPLATQIRKAGFQVVQWTYPTWFTPIEEHAQQFADVIDNLRSSMRVHIVAHSMGAIVARAALIQCSEKNNVGRLVQLSPPNHGSPVARIVGNLLGGILKPTRDLSDSNTSYVNSLPEYTHLQDAVPFVEIGIIAARFDLLVPLKSTFLACAKEHRTLRASHNSLLISPKAAALATRFLRWGTFDSQLSY